MNTVRVAQARVMPPDTEAARMDILNHDNEVAA